MTLTQKIQNLNFYNFINKLKEILILLVQTPDYKEYVAVISQSNEEDPTVTVLKNTFSSEIVWTRTQEGEYVATLAEAFTDSKTAVYFTNSDYTSNYEFVRANQDSLNLNINALADATPVDSGISEATVKVVVYN
jgi:uncharacterized short protein YbdD (DUF466 family)